MFVNPAEIFSVALGCLLKPLFVIPAARLSGVSFVDCFLGGVIGGCSGLFIFMQFLDIIVHYFQKIFVRDKKDKIKKKKPVFTKRSRFIVKTINQYGLSGLAIITPFLSIPLAAFIAERLNDKFIQNKRKTLTALFTSMAIWSAIFSGLSGLFKFT